MMRRQRQWTARGVVLAVLLVLFVAVAGCGSSGSDNDVATAGGASGDPSASAGESPAADEEERQLQLTRCLRENGLDVPDDGLGSGTQSPGSVDQDKARKAMEACRQYASGGAAGQTLSPEDQQQMLDYFKCLRGQGIELSDPDPNTGRPRQQDLAKFRNPDAKMQAAQQACVEQRPEGFGGGGQ